MAEKWTGLDAARVVQMIEDGATRISDEMIERGAQALERRWPDRFSPGSGAEEAKVVLSAALATTQETHNG